MENSLNELEKHFDILVVEKQPEKYSQALADYLLFIEETSPFNTIARRMDKPMIVSALYKELEQLLKKNNGMTPAVLSYSFWDIEHTRPFVRTFHDRIIKRAIDQGLTRKKTIILDEKIGNQRICLVGKEPLCYPLKGEETERFKIVLILYRTETGKTAGEIFELLYHKKADKDDQNKIKIAIREINFLFKKDTGSDRDLIPFNKNRGKNVYFLNRKDFNFKKEK